VTDSADDIGGNDIGANDIESRVSILEHEVAQLREQAALSSSDATAARVLAAGADRDVSEVRSELRAHTRALNALRETQLEQGRMLAEHGRILDEHGRAIVSLKQAIIGLDQKMSNGFATLNTGMAQIVALLNGHSGPES
jgi:chromosome segregation ATPase